MAKRQWKHLVPGTTYILSAGDGWALSMNPDGTVSLASTGSASDAKSVDLSITPDPGDGEKDPPTK